jgi:hypothetical protein
MSLSIEEWKNLTAAAQSVATIASFIVGGIWVYRKYIRQQERYPNIEFSADIQFTGVQDGHWIAEIVATVENKGKAQHRMEEFAFDLSGIERDKPVLTDQRWGNQVDFPVPIAKGSLLPAQYRFFFIDPGVKAKYSYVASIPVTVSFAILHCWFTFCGSERTVHVVTRHEWQSVRPRSLSGQHRPFVRPPIVSRKRTFDVPAPRCAAVPDSRIHSAARSH